MKVVVISFLIAAASAFTAFSQPLRQAAEAPLQEVYLAKGDGFGGPGEPAGEFLTTDVPIYCVVVLRRPSTAVVKMDLIAADVPGLRPGSKIISTTFTTSAGQDRVIFNGRPQKAWFAGVYRADIYIDGAAAGKIEFRIAADAATKPVNAPLPGRTGKARPQGKKP